MELERQELQQLDYFLRQVLKILEAVTAAKRNKLRAAAQQYLLEHPSSLQPRFDVAQVFASQGMRTAHPRIEYVENAF